MSDVFGGLPTSIRIGPYDHKVIVKEIIPDDGSTVFGEFSSERLEITIHPSNHPHDHHIVDTLLHEILHGLFEYSGLDLKVEERICSFLGTGLMQVIRDNPELVKWLTKAVA